MCGLRLVTIARLFSTAPANLGVGLHFGGTEFDERLRHELASSARSPASPLPITGIMMLS
jgi:hypothetical protein